jgi:hypothetical protein
VGHNPMPISIRRKFRQPETQSLCVLQAKLPGRAFDWPLFSGDYLLDV